MILSPQPSTAGQAAPGESFAVPTSASKEPERGAAARQQTWLPLFGLYALLTLVLVLPSASLWWREPFEVLRYNFNWFCGTFDFLGWPVERLAFVGRFVQAILFAALGICFFRLATRHADALERAPRSHIVFATAVLLAIHFAGLPWLNPDVFWVIGRSWVDAGYGLEAYQMPIAALPNYAADPMFKNIDPGLLALTGNYGPIHHSIAALLAGLSGGSIKLAVILFKLVDLGFLLGCGGVLYALARHFGLRAQHLTFCYLANPVVPLIFVAWGHNDVMQNFFLLLTVFCLVKERPLLSGLSLGAAIAIKYVAIVLLPALIIYWWRRKDWKVRAPLLAFLGVAAIVIYAHTLYAGSLLTTIKIYTVGWSPMRSSLYTVAAGIAQAFGATTLGPFRIAAAAFYVLSGAVLTFACLWRKKVQPLDFIMVCVWIFNFYFLFAAPAVLEWYLTWNLAFLLLLPAYFRSFVWLYSFYLVLVPFTLYLRDAVLYPVNIALYLFFVLTVVVLSPWRLRRPAPVEALEIRSPVTSSL